MKRLVCHLAWLILTAPLMIVCGGKADSSLPTLPRYDFNINHLCYVGLPITYAMSPSPKADSQKVYRLKQPTVDEEYATEMARRFGISSPAVLSPDIGKYIADDGKAHFDVDGSGYVGFSSGVHTAGGTPLSEAEATQTARRFLESVGLLPDWELTTSYKASTSTGDAQVRFQMAGITMAYPLDYQQMAVVMGSGGDVREVAYRWQEPEVVGDYPTVSETEARKRLEKCDAFITLPEDTVTLGSVELKYVGVPIFADSLQYLFPVYKFEPPSPDISPSIEYAWVPAIADKYLEENTEPLTPSP